MKRYVFVLLTVAGLLLLTGASALAQPADPPETHRGPAIRVGGAWGAILGDRGGAHNFVRPAPDEVPTFSVMPGTTVRVTAGASGLWFDQSGGTLSASLEVYMLGEQGERVLLGEDSVSETKAGPAFDQRRLGVPVSFDLPGEANLLVQLRATAQPDEGELVEDVVELEASVIIFDPETFGSISGQVTADDTGAGLEGLRVTAGNPETRVRRTARTDADGHFTIEGLPPGDYAVGVDAGGTAYVGELYDDVRTPEEATPVTVAEASDTPGIDLGLARGGEVSGRVTDEDGEPLARIRVAVHPTPPPEDADGAGEARTPRREPGRVEHKQHRPRHTAVTAEDGTYVIQGLPAGEYVVVAIGVPEGYGVEFWQEAETPEEATPVVVELGQSVTDVDFTLEPQ